MKALFTSLLFCFYLFSPESRAQCTGGVVPSGPTEFCQGGSVDLNASGSGAAPLQYLWSNGQTTPSITVNTSGSYWVRITDANGCIFSTENNPIPILVRPLPIAYTVGPDFSVCEFFPLSNVSTEDPSVFSVSLSDSEVGVVYSLWRDGTNISSLEGSGSELFFPTVTQAGLYTVNGTNTYGCTSMMNDEANITLLPSPSSFVVSGDETICLVNGASTPITLSGSESNVKYQLIKDGIYHSYYDYNMNPDYWREGTQDPIVWSGYQANYRVVAVHTQSLCARNLGELEMVNLPVTSFYDFSGGGVLCTNDVNGKSVNISTSKVGVKYQLRRDGVDYRTPLDGNGNSLSWLGILDPGNYTIYSYAPTDPTCGRLSTEWYPDTFVNVRYAKPYAQDRLVCSGQGFNVPITSNIGSVVYSYTVKSASPNVSGYSSGTGTSISQILTNTSAEPGTVVYTITILNECQGLPHDVTVTVNPAVSLTVSALSSTICAGDSTTITASGAASYTWSPSTGLSSTTGASVSARPTATTTYTVQGTTNGCTASGTVTITVKTLPTISVSASKGTICVGENTSLTASGAISYAWSPSTDLSSATGSSVTATPASTTNYTVVGTASNGCASAKDISVVVNPKPNVLINATTDTICNRLDALNATLTASGALTYSWSPGESLSATSGASVIATPLATTTYTVTGTDGNNCSNTATYKVNVGSLPIAVTPPSASICSGASIPLTASGANNYAWSPTTGLAPTSGASVAATPTATTTYTVAGTAGTCSGMGSVTVTVIPRPSPTISGPSSACPGSSTTYTTQTGKTGYAWTVSTGGTITSGQGTHSITVNWSPATSGPKNITVNYTENGCTANSPATYPVAIQSVPQPYLTMNYSYCTNYGYVRIIANGATGATSYTWSAGGTTTTAYKNIYVEGNQYVTANYPNGCSRSSATEYVEACNSDCGGQRCPFLIGEPQISITETKIYPNPATEKLTIELPARTTVPIKGKITSMMGFETDFLLLPGSYMESFQTKGFSKGIYIIRLYSPEGDEVLSRKIVITH